MTQAKTKLPPDLLITVCQMCLCASCWQGRLYCKDAVVARSIDLPVERLLELDREDPAYWLNDPHADAYRVHELEPHEYSR